MKCDYACNTTDHAIARRTFLGGLAAGLGAAWGHTGAVRPLMAQQLERRQKRILQIYLAGGASQLETWDPKPGTDTGGPFRAIATSVPGIHISELLPHTAQQMHRLMLIRGVNTAENDHGLGSYIVHTGRKKEPATEYPHLGSVVAKCLQTSDDPLPGYIHISGGTGLSPGDAAYLGPRYASVSLASGDPPPNTKRPDGMSDHGELVRHAVRQHANDRFARRRRTAETLAYSSSFAQAGELMRRRDIFDVGKESAQDVDRYGTYEFGRQMLLARRLLENGIPFVKVSHSNYDTHNENFDFHLEQIGEFDRPFACLIQDLAERGLLDDTLVIVNSEFGRTPNINLYCGRDHWGSAWSVVMAGGGIQRGGAYGQTNANGTEVVEGQVGGGQLFHTYLRAVGIDSSASFDVGGRDLPMADPSAAPIDAVLA